MDLFSGKPSNSYQEVRNCKHLGFGEVYVTRPVDPMLRKFYFTKAIFAKIPSKERYKKYLALLIRSWPKQQQQNKQTEHNSTEIHFEESMCLFGSLVQHRGRVAYGEGFPHLNQPHLESF